MTGQGAAVPFATGGGASAGSVCSWGHPATWHPATRTAHAPLRWGRRTTRIAHGHADTHSDRTVRTREGGVSLNGRPSVCLKPVLSRREPPMGDEPVEHDPRDGEAARPEDSTAWQDATLRRPALDPAIPRAARDLLRARGDLLAPATPDLGRRRSLLPASGERREAMVSNAVTGLTTALFVAVVGATPWALGVLVFQQPVGWQSAAGRYGLLLAELIIAVTAIAFGSRVARFGEVEVEDEAVSAARTYY